MNKLHRPTVALIDLDAITNNINFIKSKLQNRANIMTVVKADAYGHGAISIVKHLQSIGINHFAVAFLDEAIQLRKAGILDPILVLGSTPITSIDEAFKYDITLTVFTKKMVEQIDEIGKSYKKKLKIHIKVDTGMGRIGVFPEEAEEFLIYIKDKHWIEIEGIFTHFATADERDKAFTLKQYELFKKMMDRLLAIHEIPLQHLSNSAASIDLPELEQNMVRLGISLYGLFPSDEVNVTREELTPVMTLKTEIIFLKEIRAGQTVSYGATYIADKNTLVATLPIGYADGLPRKLSNKGSVLIHGKRAPIIGRVCMDQIMIDVTHIPSVEIGDEVVIFGSQSGDFISLNELAGHADTINYELATLIGKRVPRIYMKNGEVINIVNLLL